MSKYRLVFHTEEDEVHEDGMLLTHDTDNEPPRVGEWLDLSEFGVLGVFLVKRLTHQLGHTGPDFVLIEVEKKLKT